MFRLPVLARLSSCFSLLARASGCAARNHEKTEFPGHQAVLAWQSPSYIPAFKNAASTTGILPSELAGGNPLPPSSIYCGIQELSPDEIVSKPCSSVNAMPSTTAHAATSSTDAQQDMINLFFEDFDPDTDQFFELAACGWAPM